MDNSKKTLSQSKSSTTIKQTQQTPTKSNQIPSESEQTFKIMNKQPEKTSFSTSKPKVKGSLPKGTQDKSNSSTMLPSIQITNSSSASKPMTTAQECEKILQADSNKLSLQYGVDSSNCKTKTGSKLQSNFRQDTKSKTGVVFRENNNNDQRPSLKNPQSLLVFQNQVLANSNNNSNGRVRFGSGNGNDCSNDNSKTNSTKKINDIMDHSSQEMDSGEEEETDDLGPKTRIIRKCLGVSQPGKKENQTQPKENQDSYVMLINVLGLAEYNIYGVMDGHGPNGHYVSRHIKKTIEEYFTKEDSYFVNKKSKAPLTEALISTCLIQHDYYLIKDFYKKLQNELIDEKFDVHYSGSTCVIAFHIGKKIICANTGDSRAIIVKDANISDSMPIDKTKLLYDPCYYYEVIELSHDHKPNDPKEKERIEKMGGSVEQKVEPGVITEDTKGSNEYEEPYRVYVKGESYPGIAVSRSLGDEIAQSIGVIYTPDITVHEVTEAYQYMTLASDGVWEFLSNDKVMQIINAFYIRNDIKTACEVVISESTAWWKKEDIRIDDITIIIVFLGHVHIKKTTV